jgi:hypothetical protein
MNIKTLIVVAALSSLFGCAGSVGPNQSSRQDGMADFNAARNEAEEQIDATEELSQSAQKKILCIPEITKATNDPQTVKLDINITNKNGNISNYHYTKVKRKSECAFKK